MKKARHGDEPRAALVTLGSLASAQAAIATFSPSGHRRTQHRPHEALPARSVRTAVRSELTGITPKTAAGTAQTVPTIEGFPGTETQPRGGG